MKSLNEVIGHKAIVQFLQHKIETDNLPQVIIFHGNPGLGKTSISNILAVEVNAIARPDLRESLERDVIDEDKSVSCVKKFNMSSLKDEEVEAVLSEVSVGLSNTGRKVLILDECHGMTKAQQDAILVLIDPPPKGVYVIMCTTEIGSLRGQLVSRGKAVLYLKSFSSLEVNQLAKRIIAKNRLTFDIGESKFLYYLSLYTERQARNILNLLSNFEPGSNVSNDTLEVFIDVTVTRKVLKLIEYLYVSMAGGIEFIQDLRIDNVLIEALIAVTSVATGNRTDKLTQEELQWVNSFFRTRDISNLIKFTAELSSLDELTRRRVTGVFMRNCVDFDKLTSPKKSTFTEGANLQDIKAIREVEPEIKGVLPNKPATGSVVVPSLETLFNQASIVED